MGHEAIICGEDEKNGLLVSSHRQLFLIADFCLQKVPKVLPDHRQNISRSQNMTRITFCRFINFLRHLKSWNEIRGGKGFPSIKDFEKRTSANDFGFFVGKQNS